MPLNIRLKENAASATSVATAYTAHASGATAVTSNAATDLDTTAAALAALVVQVNKLVIDVEAIRSKFND